MVKDLVKLLIVGSGCTSVAVISTSYAGVDGDNGKLLTGNENKESRITEIKSYGDIEAYGNQNKCAFRIIDETEEGGKAKEYSLGEFWVAKEKEIKNLESRVVEVAKKVKGYCGVNSSVIGIFYNNNKKQPPEKEFMLKADPLIKDNPKKAE